MKHQQVSVDYWAMGKTMLMYAFLTAVGWLMLRLFNTVFMLPRRLRSQQRTIEDTLKDLQKRFPDMNITEDDLKNAEKELEEYIKDGEDKEIPEPPPGEGNEKLEEKTEDKEITASPQLQEDKKTI